jgi:transposase
MRVYIINADDLIVSREAPVRPGENEIVVASLDELHAARLNGKRLLALWNGLPGVDRLTKVGEREALVDRLASATAHPEGPARRRRGRALRPAPASVEATGPSRRYHLAVRRRVGSAQAALAVRDWLTIEWRPKYAPELNDIERSWRDLKRHFLAHQTFTDIDHLDRAIHQAIADMNQERQSTLCTNLRIAA